MTIMKKYDQSVEINHNPNWPYITDLILLTIELNKRSTARY